VIRTTPGWELLDLQRDGVWQARALRDPDAASATSLQSRAGVAADQVHWQLSPYLSLHPDLILTRARRVLNPPPGVQIDFKDGELILSGTADADWVAGARLRAPLLPGIRTIRDEALQQQPVLSDADQLAQSREALARSVVPFASGTTELLASAESLDRLAQHAQAALSAADRLGLPVVLHIEGWSDESGSERRNTRLRSARADVVRDALVSRGVAVERLQLDREGRAMASSPGARIGVKLPDPD
jgi:outer membrane protein OmpA-like peptidoglycan-associated protein